MLWKNQFANILRVFIALLAALSLITELSKWNAARFL